MARVSLKWSEYIPHKPTPKQAAFLALNTREAFYGGAAGGGKSDALLMAALQYVDIPGYSALLLRRTYADLALPGALMDRSHEWLRGTDARWSEQKKQWLFPSGATLQFGYLDNEDAKYRYQGAELQFVGFDELTQFTESQYKYLFSRIRRQAESGVPLRMRSASNPGGRGHEWVRTRFVEGGGTPERPFVPAKLSDNWHLDRDAYEDSLRELDPVTLAQLLGGDWEVRPQGNMFKRDWFQVIEPEEIPDNLRWVRYWDLAATAPKPGRKKPDYTVGVLMGTNGKGYYIADVRRDQKDPPGVEDLVLQTASSDGAGVAIRLEREGGSTGKIAGMHWARALARYDFRHENVTGSKLERARPLSGAAKNGLVYLVRGIWNSPYLDELEAFPSESVPDDQVDGSSGAYGELTQPRAAIVLRGQNDPRSRRRR